MSESKIEKLKEMILRGHIHEPNKRCTAMEEKQTLTGRPPGPASLPVFCCLPAGHEGPHKCNRGGMCAPFPFRTDVPVRFLDAGPGICIKCRTTWPCPTVHEVNAILEE